MMSNDVPEFEYRSDAPAPAQDRSSRRPVSLGANSTNTPSSAPIETLLVDLTDVWLAALNGFDARALAASRRRMMSQVKHPRTNLNSGPPGRVD